MITAAALTAHSNKARQHAFLVETDRGLQRCSITSIYATIAEHAPVRRRFLCAVSLGRSSATWHTSNSPRLTCLCCYQNLTSDLTRLLALSALYSKKWLMTPRQSRLSRDSSTDATAPLLSAPSDPVTLLHDCSTKTRFETLGFYGRPFERGSAVGVLPAGTRAFTKAEMGSNGNFECYLEAQCRNGSQEVCTAQRKGLRCQPQGTYWRWALQNALRDLLQQKR